MNWKTKNKVGLAFVGLGIATVFGSQIFGSVVTPYERLQDRQEEVKAETASLQGMVDEQFQLIQEAMAARGIAIPDSAQTYCDSNIASSQFCSDVDVLARLNEEYEKNQPVLFERKSRYYDIAFSGLGAGVGIMLTGVIIGIVGFNKYDKERLKQENDQNRLSYGKP